MNTALACLRFIAKFNGVDVDVRIVEREISTDNAELTVDELLRAAKRLDFKARVKKLPIPRLSDKYPFPAIVQLKDNSYGLILKLSTAEQKILLFLPREGKAGEISFAQANELCNPMVLVLAHRVFNAQVRFGFQWFYTEILKFRRIIFEVMSASFFIQLFGLVSPLLTQVVLDRVIVHRTLSTLDVLAVAFFFLAASEFLLNLARNYVFTQAANKIDAILGAKLFRHLFSLPYTYFAERRVGIIAARVRELDNIREFITSKSISVIVDLVFSVVFLVMMIAYSWILAAVVCGFVGIIALIYIILTPELRKRLESKFQMASNNQSFLVESLTGIKTVKSLAIEGTLQRRWEDSLARYLQSSFNLATMGNVANCFSNLCQKLMTIAILYLGVRLVIENKMTIGQLIAFQMFANQFTAPVIRLCSVYNEFQQALLSVDRLGDILNNPVEVSSSKAITLPKVEGSIEFNKISFRYGMDGPNVLKNLSLKINPGTSIALVGQSGSGKSTLANLLLRLQLPLEGAVFVDGVDVRHMNASWLRSNMGIVPQESFLFTGTIRENIAMTRPDAPIEHIIEAATIAGAHEFISKMPLGYDTVVGERGSTLSGGQKQRIAIACALISDPKILIFDEATSALDYESEAIIQENLRKIKAGRTFIIIAHRLSTVQDCDVIVVLHEGEIVEMGSPSQLLAQNGAYAKLYSKQLSTSFAVNPMTQPNAFAPAASVHPIG